MPYYRRSVGSYRRGRFGSRYASRYFRRYWRRPSVYRSQLNSTRQFTVCIPIENIYELPIASNSHYSALFRTNPFNTPSGPNIVAANMRISAQSLILSKLFQTYIGLYDQMKVNWVRHKIGVGLQIGGAGASAVKIYTSWDRRLTSSEPVPTFEDMQNGPESQCQMFVENSRPQFVRYCAARDLIERSQFFDCKTIGDASSAYISVQAWRSSNVNFFAPAMFMGLETADAIQATRTIPISVSSTYSVTFRQPRFGLSVAAGRGVDSGVRKSEPVESVDDDTIVVDDGEMEEKGPDTEEKGGDTGEKEVRTDMTDEEISALLEKLRVSKEKG